jgi:hypothetical protein
MRALDEGDGGGGAAGAATTGGTPAALPAQRRQHLRAAPHQRGHDASARDTGWLSALLHW